jgi:hypothetical protein
MVMILSLLYLTQEEYAKEREELLAGQRAEMQQKFEALVQGWAQEVNACLSYPNTA